MNGEEESEVQWVEDDKCYIFDCPHCDGTVQVPEHLVNCQIFRHGTIKDTCIVRRNSDQELIRVTSDKLYSETVDLKRGDNVTLRASGDQGTVISMQRGGQQINPHAPQSECDRLVDRDLIWGCGKPFRLLRDANNRPHRARQCAYI